MMRIAMRAMSARNGWIIRRSRETGRLSAIKFIRRRKVAKIICRSGLMGWKARLQTIYQSFDEFVAYCNICNIHSRLGYKTPKSAWANNPKCQGSVIPSDLQRVNV